MQRVKACLKFYSMIGAAAVLSGGPIPAFPGAEGFGRYVSGGRGGEVIYVTNLNDSGPGTLRGAIEATGPRTVLFAVSGTIFLESPLRIENSDLTIAGQTAPGEGITLAQHPLEMREVDNVIIRFIRSRLGDTFGLEDDAFDCRRSRNIMIDHCSFSWGIDEVASMYDNVNFTMQWSIISESLRDSAHEKGLHGYGGIWGGRGATFHHNLIAHHDSRNPRLNGARYHGQRDELVDFRHNVIYNWRSNSVYGGEPTREGKAARHNIVENYFKAGPSTNRHVRDRIFQPSSLKGHYSLFYIANNHVEASAAVTADNWKGGVAAADEVLATIRAPEPFAAPPVAGGSSEETLRRVLAFAGATVPFRDAVDTRVIEETRAGRYTFRGSRSDLPGIIDSQKDVGGWPQLASTAAPLDSDGDGIPDEWELAHGLDPHDPADGRVVCDITGYTHLENYLNSLVAAAFPSAP